MLQERIADLEKVLKILIMTLEKTQQRLLYGVSKKGQDSIIMVKISAEIRNVTSQLVYLNNIREHAQSGTNNKV